MKYLTKSPSQTKKIGKNIAAEIIKKKKGPVVLALKGNLGAGKTVFAQGLAKGIGIAEKILSPTFLILKKFKIKKGIFKEFYHIDCYRLKNKKDILSTGIKEAIEDPLGIVVIEWAEKIKNALPKNTIWIEIKQKENENEREIILTK